MNVYAISDLHLSIHSPKPMDIFGGNWENYVEEIVSDWKSKVTRDDIVLIGGDISWAMTLAAAVPDLNFIGELPGKKVMVKGNHDYWWSSISRLRGELTPGTFALQNDAIAFPGIVLAGSRGWTVPDGATGEHDEKIYRREAERMELSLKAMEKLDGGEAERIVLMHFPPFNVRRGSSLFTDLFEKYRVSAVIYGHLHGTACRTDPLIVRAGIRYYLTACDQVANRLVKIEADPA